MNEDEPVSKWRKVSEDARKVILERRRERLWQSLRPYILALAVIIVVLWVAWHAISLFRWCAC